MPVKVRNCGQKIVLVLYVLNSYIFYDIQVMQAVLDYVYKFYIWDYLEVFTRSEIQPLLKTLWRSTSRPVNSLLFSCGWSAVSLKFTPYHFIFIWTIFVGSHLNNFCWQEKLLGCKFHYLKGLKWTLICLLFKYIV